MLLTCLEDIAQPYPSYCSSYIPEIRTIVLFLPFQKSWPQNKPHLAAEKICRLVVGEEASTLSILHGIANCVKNGTTKKIVSSLQPMSASRCSVAHNYCRSSLRILFTAFLETKTYL